MQVHKSNKSVFMDVITTTWEDKETRRILSFLLLNASFMLVELIYGYLSNSLSLIGDGFHMMVDSMALLVGLVAAYISKRDTRTWKLPFGYMKIESLSALFNGLFLVSVSYNLFFKSMDRLINPQKINMEEYNTELIVVSIGGLIINLCGLFFFSEGEDDDHNDNIQGLFLHVLADTLGSVGVLLSCFLIKNYNIEISDPLCAMLVSIMIFLSVLPLLKSSCISLLGQTPASLESKQQEIADAISAVSNKITLDKMVIFEVNKEEIVANISLLVNFEKEAPAYQRDDIINRTLSILVEYGIKKENAYVMINSKKELKDDSSTNAENESTESLDSDCDKIKTS